MNNQYHVKLNNEYEFKYICSQKSIKGFESVLKKGNFPSRFLMINHLVKEAIYEPFYLAGKVGEIALNILRMSVKIVKQKSLNVKDIAKTAELIILQTLIPVVCTVMRIFATIVGFVYIPWAIKGWKLAESGESLSYLLWSDFFIKFDCQNSNKKIYKDIVPSNALFYLGEKRILPDLDQDFEDQLNQEIETEFNSLVKTLFDIDRNTFDSIFDYEIAKSTTKGTKNIFIPFSEDIKDILKTLRANLKEDYTSKEFCDQIWKKLSLEKVQKLFTYTYFHLRAAQMNGTLNVNPTTIETHFTQLKDLFSQRFGFGRAHFPSSLWNFESLECD